MMIVLTIRRRLSRRPARGVCGALLAAALLVSGAERAALAQTDYSTLVIFVTEPDPTQPGAAVKESPGKTVTVAGERGERRQCETKADGVCRFGGLEPGLYSVEVGGTRRAYRVSPGQVVTRQIPFTAALTSAAAAVDAATEKSRRDAEEKAERRDGPVSFAGPLEERSRPGRLGVVANARDVEALSGRNQTATPLVELLPGAFEEADRLFINGSSQNVVRVDGLDTTPLELSSASFQDTGAALAKLKDRQSINSYESFSVDTSNTPAKFGTGTGGQLLQTIKSGKDTFAGKLYEYFAHDALSARNFFDFAEKPSLRFHLFGLNLSGRLLKRQGDPADPDDERKLFAFFNYEGIRASSGVLLFEAAPNAAARARAAAAVAPLFDAYRAGGATLVPGASSNPDFDILRLDTKNYARKDGVTLRFDYNPRKLDALNFIYQGAVSTEDIPDGVTGRRGVTRNAAHTGIFNYKRVLTRKRDDGGALEDNPKLTNQFIFGVRADPVRVSARRPLLLGNLDLSAVSVGIGGQIAQTGILGRPSPLGVATPGGLLPGADFGRRGLRFEPYQFSFVDQLTWEGERHHLSFGGEVRLLRTTVNQLFGTAYSFPTLSNFLDNRPTVEFVGDLGSFTGAAGERKTAQEYYIAYWQDAWGLRRNMNLTYGLRYEYYSALREAGDRALILDPATGTLLPPDTPFYRTRKGNLLPRISFAWAPRCDTLPGDLPRSQQKKAAVIGPGAQPVPEEPCVINTNPTVISASFGMHTGPDALDNILRPVTSDRVRLRQTGLSFPTDAGGLVAAFNADPPDRNFQPLALARDYLSSLRVYKFDVSLKRALISRVVTDANQDNDDKHVMKELFVQLSYQGTRSRNLVLHNFANRIVSVETNPDPTQPAIVRREFDAESGGQLRRPFGEIDYLTTGGRARYDSLQVTLTGRARKHLRYFQAAYTLARNHGNSDGDGTAGAGSPLDFDYDLGYLAGDVRHKFSFGAVFILECGNFSLCERNNTNAFLRELLGGWNVGAIGTFQSGAPVDVRISRPDVVYLDAAGNVFGKQGVGRRAVLNVPGGGSSVAAYRPNLVPGANPYTDGFDGRRFLNPAAFSTPAPGELGDLARGALRGPGLRVVSISLRKDINFVGRDKTRTLRFHADITNLFNFTNFKLGAAKLPNVLGLDAAGNQLQPGQPYTALAAPDFGVLNRTAKSKQDLGSSRQIQFGLSFDF